MSGQRRRSLHRTASSVFGEEVLGRRIPVGVDESADVIQKAVEELAEEVAAVSLAAGRSTSSSCAVLVGNGGGEVFWLWSWSCKYSF